MGSYISFFLRNRTILINTTNEPLNCRKMPGSDDWYKVHVVSWQHIWFLHLASLNATANQPTRLATVFLCSL